MNNQSVYRKNNIFARLGLMLIALLFSLSLVACGSPSATTISNNANTTSAAATTAASTATTVGSTTTNAASTTNAATTSSAAAATTAAAARPNTSADQIESNTVVGVVQKVSPAVVTIYNKTSSSPINRNVPGGRNAAPTPGSSGDGSSNNFRTQGIGSGVIFSDQGYIITNAHVVEGEQSVSVAYNNGKQVVPAKVVGVDTTGDIAVLKVEGTVPAVAKFGDSSKLQIGETVIAIGAALGDFRNSVTKGVVSGLNRTLDNTPSVYVQTDTPINHGNSGGPLLNLQGEIIGINTAVLRSTPSATGVGGDVAEGLGFSIPSNIAKNLADQLVSKGSVTRPYFGISYQMITPAIAGTVLRGGTTVPAVEGAWISSSTTSATGTSRSAGVVAGSPADKAGLKENDVITAINDVPLNDNNPLVSAVLSYKPGDTIKLSVQRGNQTLTVNLTLAERPQNLN